LQENMPKELLTSVDRYQVDYTLELLQKSGSDCIIELRETYLQDICQSEALRILTSYFSCIENVELLFSTLLSVAAQGGLDPISAVKSDSESSSSFYSAIAHASLDLIVTRHELVRNVLLVLLLASQLKLNPGPTVISALTKETIVLFHSLSVMKRISSRYVEASEEGDNCLLFEHLIRHHYLWMNTVEFDSKTITALASQFINSLGLVQRGKVLQTTDSVLVFANKMVAFGHHEVASTILFLYPSSPASCFLKGQVKLELKDYEKAKYFFEQASSGIFTSKEAVGDLSIVLSADILKGGIVAYAGKIVEFFADKNVHKMVIYFAKMALDCAPIDTHPDQIQLFKRAIFNHNLYISGFDEAYAALVTISNKERYLLSFTIVEWIVCVVL
jgi:hypothetical protein